MASTEPWITELRMKNKSECSGDHEKTGGNIKTLV